MLISALKLGRLSNVLLNLRACVYKETYPGVKRCRYFDNPFSCAASWNSLFIIFFEYKCRKQEVYILIPKLLVPPLPGL